MGLQRIGGISCPEEMGGVNQREDPGRINLGWDVIEVAHIRNDIC